VTADRFAREMLGERRALVCVGCGGVGKTTVAAALGLEAARRGRRVLVLTIDPARRLADALGVKDLGNEPRELPEDALRRLGVAGEGRLSAMMLDMKRTFDDLVTRFAEGPEARERILQNRIYQHASDALAGSAEYSAMEKVYEMVRTGGFDLVVVDTPPAQHALEFLEAPQRLLEFLDSRLVQVLIHPAFAAGRFGFRVFQRGTQRVLRLIERVSGFGFLEDVSEFLLAFEHMSEGFRERARRVRGLLLGPDTSFVLVAGPAEQSVHQAEDFLARLEDTGVRLSGVLLNRVRLWPDEDGRPTPGLAPPDDVDAPEGRAHLAEALRARFGTEFDSEGAARAAVDAAKEYALLVERDARVVRPLRQRTRDRFWSEIPELADDVHDLEGLARIAAAIFGAEPADTPARAGSRPRRAG